MADQGGVVRKRRSAEQARRLAGQLSSDEDRARVLRFAQDLDDLANELDRPAAVRQAGRPTTQPQQQAQQQHTTTPADPTRKS
jgi:hypothetical protein